RLAPRLVTERSPRQDSIAFGGMASAIDMMANIVKMRSEGLSNTGMVVSVPAPACCARNEGSAQESLAIHDIVIASCPNIAKARGNLAQPRPRVLRVFHT